MTAASPDRAAAAARDIDRRCRCDWRRLAAGGWSWELTAVNARCMLHGEGCHSCQGQGYIRKRSYPVRCPACAGAGIRPGR